LAADIGLSAGTDGTGKPGGSRQSNAGCGAWSGAGAAGGSVADEHAVSISRTKTGATPASPLPGKWPSTVTPRAIGRRRQPRRLGGELGAFFDPGGEGVDVVAGNAHGVGAARRKPFVHRFHQLVGEAAVEREEVHVGLLRVVDAVEAEVGFAAVLDRLGVARRDRQGLLIGFERPLVVAGLAQRVAQAAVGLVEARHFLGGGPEQRDRLLVLLPGLAEELGALVLGRRGFGLLFELPGLVALLEAQVVGGASCLFRGLGHRRRRWWRRLASRRPGGSGDEAGEEEDGEDGGRISHGSSLS
jgi:hypothetical protein